MPKLEIAATSLEDALHAQQGGADSIEISYDLSVGGLTPDLDLVQAVCGAVLLNVYVMVRPHARDFQYQPDEIDLILSQVRSLSSFPVKGIVFGALDADRYLDVPLIRRVVEAAYPLPVTVHRALDESTAPDQSLQRLVDIVPRILTAGPAPTAWEGRETLRRWVQKYNEHFSFVCSGGLKMEQLAEFAAYVRAPVYHLGAASRSNGMVDAKKVKLLAEIIHTQKDS